MSASIADQSQETEELFEGTRGLDGSSCPQDDLNTSYCVH